jgi:plastocyanin
MNRCSGRKWRDAVRNVLLSNMFSYRKRWLALSPRHMTNRLKVRGGVSSIAATLIVILLALAGNALAQPIPVIAISLKDYAFTPNSLSLTGGVAYRVAFTNNEAKEHNFSAPGVFAPSQIAIGDQAKIKGGSIEIGRGQTVGINITPARAGSYAFLCTHFMRSVMGMHGMITVR